MKYATSLLFCFILSIFGIDAQNQVVDIYTERASIYAGSGETIVIENRTVILTEGLVINRNIEVRNGSLVALEGAVINGNLTVNNGASVFLIGAMVTGDYTANGAKTSYLQNASIGMHVIQNNASHFISSNSVVQGNSDFNAVRSITVTGTQMHGDSVKVRAQHNPGNSNLLGQGWGFPPTLMAMGTGWSFPPTVVGGAIIGERWLQMHGDSVLLKYSPLYFSNGQNGGVLQLHCDSVICPLFDLNLNRIFQEGAAFENNEINSSIIVREYQRALFNNNSVGGNATFISNRHIEAENNQIDGKLSIYYSLQCEENGNTVGDRNTGCPCNTTGKAVGFVDLITDVDKGIILAENNNGNGNNWNVAFNEPYLADKGIQIGDKVCYKVALIQGNPLGSDLRKVEEIE